MFGLLIIGLLIIVSIAVYYFFIKKGSKKNFLRTHTVDAHAQEVYDQSKHQTAEESLNLSLLERIELSWQFLADMRDHVINKFSKTDQEKVQEAGKKMAEHGMQYVHDIEMGIKRDVVKARSIPKDQQKDQSMSR